MKDGWTSIRESSWFWPAIWSRITGGSFFGGFFLVDVNCVCHYCVVIMHWITSSKCIILNLKLNFMKEHQNFDLRKKLIFTSCACRNAVWNIWYCSGDSTKERAGLSALIIFRTKSIFTLGEIFLRQSSEIFVIIACASSCLEIKPEFSVPCPRCILVGSFSLSPIILNKIKGLVFWIFQEKLNNKRQIRKVNLIFVMMNSLTIRWRDYLERLSIERHQKRKIYRTITHQLHDIYIVGLRIPI